MRATNHEPRATNDESRTTVSVVNRQRLLRLDRRGLRRAAQVALAAEGYRKGDLTLVFVEDEEIASLNKRYLGHRGPTDVLAFRPGTMPAPPGAPRWLGDVVVSVETAQRQAPRWRHRIGEELAEYVIHGVLHLVGYDDATGSQRRRMRRRQAALLTRWRSGRLTRSSYGA